MKSRIQIAGVKHGSKDKIIWKGDLPVLSGVPGMRIVINDSSREEPLAFSFKQVCLEIDSDSNDVEQVVYVMSVDRSVKID